MRKIIFVVIAVIGMQSLQGQGKTLFTAGDYVRALKHATDVMVTDVTSPVAAARYYAYINLAANETIALYDKQQPHFVGTVKGLNSLTVDENLVLKSDPQLSTTLSTSSIVALIFSGESFLLPATSFKESIFF